MVDAERQAQGEINDAARAVKRIWTEPGTAALLRWAKGVLIVPFCGRGAYFLGGQGGHGVLCCARPGRNGASRPFTPWAAPAQGCRQADRGDQSP
jgi:lipid-binding SYLF domain-containing protein